MQDTVPIHLVGKHTAYAVKLAPEDFATWGTTPAARNWPGGLKYRLNLLRSIVDHFTT